MLLGFLIQSRGREPIEDNNCLNLSSTFTGNLPSQRVHLVSIFFVFSTRISAFYINKVRMSQARTVWGLKKYTHVISAHVTNSIIAAYVRAYSTSSLLLQSFHSSNILILTVSGPFELFTVVLPHSLLF